MIDYDKPDDAPIVAEVRRIREEIAGRCSRRTDSAKRQSGRTYADRTPQPLVPNPAKKVG